MKKKTKKKLKQNIWLQVFENIQNSSINNIWDMHFSVLTLKTIFVNSKRCFYFIYSLFFYCLVHFHQIQEALFSPANAKTICLMIQGPVNIGWGINRYNALHFWWFRFLHNQVEQIYLKNRYLYKKKVREREREKKRKKEEGGRENGSIDLVSFFRVQERKLKKGFYHQQKLQNYFSFTLKKAL